MSIYLYTLITIGVVLLLLSILLFVRFVKNHYIKSKKIVFFTSMIAVCGVLWLALSVFLYIDLQEQRSNPLALRDNDTSIMNS